MRRWPIHLLSALVVFGFSWMAWISLYGAEGEVRFVLGAMAFYQAADCAFTWFKFTRRRAA